MTFGIRRAPLDAITQEVIISLADEPERWRDRPMPAVARVMQTCLERDDGLVVHERESMVSPWRERRVSAWAGGGRYDARGANQSAMLKAVTAWRVWRAATSAERVSAFLARR